MGGAVKPLADLEAFSTLTLTMSDNPLLGVLVGTVMTIIIQSSTATIGILQGFMAEDWAICDGWLCPFTK